MGTGIKNGKVGAEAERGLRGRQSWLERPKRGKRDSTQLPGAGQSGMGEFPLTLVLVRLPLALARRGASLPLP